MKKENVSLEDRLEAEVESIFRRNGEEFTDECKRFYSSWPDGEAGSRIKKEVNAAIKRFKEEDSERTFNEGFWIGDVEVEGQKTGLMVYVSLVNQISTVNDRYYSLYSISNETGEDYVCNPTLGFAGGRSGEIRYRSKDVARVGEGYIYQFELEDILESMDGYHEEVVNIMGEECSKERVKELLVDCENPDIYKEYVDKETYRISEVIEMVEAGEVDLNPNIPKSELLSALRLFQAYSSNQTHLTLEHEKFLEENAEEFGIYKTKQETSWNVHLDEYSLIRGYIEIKNQCMMDEVNLSAVGLEMVVPIGEEAREQIIRQAKWLKSQCEEYKGSGKPLSPRG